MRLDNPPPHLWDDVSEPFGYTMRIARGSVVVEAQPDATADGFERGDYNAILPLLGTVFDEDTEASYRMDRELRILLRYFMRPLERYDDIDQAIVDRNPPAFSTLCGLDDPFGKSGDTGADFERLRYAANAGYGRTPLR